MIKLIQWLTAREKNNPYQTDKYTTILLWLAIGCVVGIIILTFLIQSQ